MKKINRPFFAILLTSAFLLQFTFSQTPQYYNANSGGIGNSIPFGSLGVTGYRTQHLIGPNEFGTPSPAPSGNITKFYINCNTSGSPTVSQLTIKMGQTALTSLPSGGYMGTMNTVYTNASVTLNATANAWLLITLNTPFSYNPAQSLVIEIGHCGYSGSGFNIWQSAGTTGIFRRNLFPGTCPGAYSSQDTRILQCGVDISTAPSSILTTICRNGINVAVPDNTPAGARDTIKMLGNVQPCALLDVNVKIDTFIHTWISDMQFSLTHNGATQVNLFLNCGGSGDNIIGCTLDDSAFYGICSGPGPPPFTGLFRPMQPLSVYNGQAPAGNWVLFMVDQFAGDLGFLKAWCIQFIYTCPTGGVTTIEVPSTYRLRQNYPNPFNPMTTITYGLPKYGQTKLVVYDVLGRVVKTLVDEFKDAGTYTVSFDGSQLSTGVYFYTLESGSFKETKRMILIK